MVRFESGSSREMMDLLERGGRGLGSGGDGCSGGTEGLYGGVVHYCCIFFFWYSLVSLSDT